MAYTYLIGWSEHKKYYYGVRFSKKSDPKELWVTYFTSSKHVKQFQKQHGDPDIIQIRKVFDDAEKARLWENKILIKMNVVNDEKWLNKTDNKSIDPDCAIKGTKKHLGAKRSEETKQKMRGPKSEQHKMNMSVARKRLFDSGYKTPNPALRDDVKKKLSDTMKVVMLGENNPMFGKKHSEETRLKMSLAAKNRKRKQNG